MKNKKPRYHCQSFRPFVDENSRVLVLGSMPGPEALRKQEYYGFNGNHFWTIMPALFNQPRPAAYPNKLKLLKHHRVAVWDVIESCIRPGAADSAIKNVKPNRIPELLKKHPGIRAVFVNGQTAFKLFSKHFGGQVLCPVYCLPSSSPANAAMPIQGKIKYWKKILTYLADDSK